MEESEGQTLIARTLNELGLSITVAILFRRALLVIDLLPPISAKLATYDSLSR